jgi:GntR family transcriptional regulator
MLNIEGPFPLHTQLEKIIRDKIANGIWQENQRISSENELCKKYELSRMTVRAVLAKLVQEELIYRVPGKGTFVSPHKIVSKPLSQMGIRAQLELMGYRNTTKLLYTKETICDTALAQKLKLEPGTLLYEIKRIRFVEEQPFSIHLSYIPQNCCKGLIDQDYDFENTQLCDVLRIHYGIEQNHTIETMEITNAHTKDAELLHIKKGYPLVHLENTLYSVGGQLTEYASVLFRGDKIKIEIHNTYNLQSST